MSLLLKKILLSSGAPTPTLGDITDPLVATYLFGGGDRPRTSLRFGNNGQILEAIGDTGIALSYNGVGDWLDDLVGFNNTDWEVRVTIDSEDNGDPGTWSGDTPGIYRLLSTTRTYTWTKDGTALGTANSVITVDLRQVSDNGNIATRSNLDHDAIVSL